jgi:uncharacterized protein (TIGR03086 family)
MTSEPTTVLAASVAGGFALLERAMAYTLGSLQLVSPELMTAPTPCTQWDLRRLLGHMNESLRTMHEATTAGHLDLADPAGGLADVAADPVAALRTRACQMMGAWADPRGPTEVAIGDAGMPAGLVAATGAVEVAVHGWDVAEACGRHRPVPSALAGELLALVQVVVDDTDRPHRFAAPVDVRPSAGPSERLLAHLGRRSD